MPGKRYSAGAIFLQVVPVFANVQRAIEDEAKNIDRALGDQMEKAGEKAGQRAGKAASKKMSEELAKGSGEFERDFHKNIDGINRALSGIDVKKLSNNLRRELTEVKKELASLKDVDITAEADFKRAYADIAVLEGRVRGLRDGVKIVFRSDIDNALKGFGKVEAAKEAISDPVDIEVRVDTKPAERAMGTFEKAFKKAVTNASDSLNGSLNKDVQRLQDRLKELSKLRIGIDISGGRARQEMITLMSELASLSQNDPEIDVKVDTGRAWAELSALEIKLAKINGDKLDIDVDVDTDKAQRSLFGLTRSGDDAANSFRSFNLVLLAGASLGPALIPALGGIAAGLLAIGPAAGVAAFGLGSVLVGFSGIGDALSALSSREEQAAMTGQTAARTQISNAEAVADAREAAAEAVENALERQKAAQERYRDSIDDVREAEQALREARAEAAGTGDNLDLQIRSNDLALDQAMLDSFNATVEFNAVSADGSATNAEQEQARINREEALLRLEELRAKAKELAAEKKKWDKEGVNGTEGVQNAQENLNDAIDAQKDAYKDLGDAARDVDEARRDGAEAVADALRNQAQALEQVSAQQNAVNNAFAKLGPEGEKFALFLFGLRGEFHKFRDDVQAVLLPAVQEAMEGFMASPNGAIARDALIGLAEGFGEFVKLLSTSLQGEAWTGFFQMLADLGPDIQAAYGGAFVAFLEAMASIMTALAPFALEFAEGLEKVMIAFAKWASSKEGQDAITDFMGYVKELAPLVLDFIIAFAEAAAAVVVALAPWGVIVLEALTGFMEILAAMDPKVLGAILTGITILIVASQVAYLAMNLIMAGAALLTSPVGLVVFAIIGIIAALALLYKTNEGFRDFMNEAWDRISKVVSDAWKKYLQPALAELGEALQMLWDEVLAPFFAWLGPILIWLAEHLIPIVFRGLAIWIRYAAWMIENVWVPAFKVIGQAIMWFWKRWAKPALEAWVAYATFMWKEVFKPTWKAIEKAWKGLMTGMEWVWDHILKPVFDYITDTALPKLKGAFQTTVDGIETVWNGLKKVVGTPIKFVLDTIINNGLIDGFNKVAGWVGMDGFDHIPIPKALQSYATGGILPGYTPGRDVHSFVSPTAGRLELSGGEAIMRPEWTAAMGSDYVNYMNDLARRGGINAIRKAGLGGYWAGGVLPLPGGSFAQHMSGYSGFAGDLNKGGGYDDYGLAVKAWKDGIVAQLNYVGDQSYGRWAVLNHSGGQSSLYAHLSNFAKIAVGDAIRAGQTVGYVGDLGNTGTPPTSHLHFEINGGAVGYADTSSAEARGRGVPGWLMDIVKDPLGAVKGWVTKPFSKASDLVTGSPIFDTMKKLPLTLVEKTTDKMWDVIPGWVKTAAGWAGDAADFVVGGVKNAAGALADAGGAVAGGVKDGASTVGGWLGLKDGGILPYNGTMMYDNGGYLPPGLTNVVNLTGKPEPVFTSEQFDGMEAGATGGNIHYEPHFEGSNLTAEDVAADVNFTFRRIKRGGKYAGVGVQ